MDIEIDRYELVRRLVRIDGKPISFYDYPTHKAIYKGGYPKFILKCGRQTAKSTTAGNLILAETIGIPHFKTIYLNPYKDQTSRFSNTRIKKTIAFSPELRPWFDSSVKAHIFHKESLNGSEIFLSYAQSNADRARGIAADRAIFDEVQDMDFQQVMPVVLECLANSDHQYQTFLGTPKTLENSIERLWDQSSQSEWVVKCPACGKRSFFVTLECIGPKGPLCRNKRCGKTITNVRNGTWINMNPGARIAGLHIPQVIIPRNVENPVRWKNIYEKLSDPAYGEVTALNEVMGISASKGARMISLDELRVLCENGPSLGNVPVKTPNIHRRFGGVDWSGGGVDGVSRTAAWIWGLDHSGKLITEWFKIYPNQNPVEVVKEIAYHMTIMGVELIVGDAGEGHVANQLLIQHMGVNKVIQVEWHAQSQPIKFNGINKYLCDKTNMFDNYILLMKREGVKFPKVPQGSLIISDIMNEFEEVTSAGRRVWKCAGGKPDDLLHAQIFAWIAFKIQIGDVNFLAQ